MSEVMIIEPTYGSVSLKKKIWKTKMPSKLHHFLWRALSRSLATGSNQKRRHITNADQCRRCCQGEETEKHILFDCMYAQQVWRASGITNSIITNPQATFEDQIEAVLQCSLSSQLQHLANYPFWILWRLWKSRNILVFQQKQINWRNILQQARKDANEWSEHGSTQSDHMAHGYARVRSTHQN